MMVLLCRAKFDFQNYAFRIVLNKFLSNKDDKSRKHGLEKKGVVWDFFLNNLTTF